MIKRFAHGSRVPGWDESVDLAKDPAVVPDPATTPVPEHVRSRIEEYAARYPDVRSAAIPSLFVVQEEHGYCSPTAIEQAACVLRLTPAYLTSVATFYDMFEIHPKGEHDVYVCTNISCSLRGGDQIYEAFLSAGGDDPRFNIRSFECLGACDIAPMASVNGVYVGPLDEQDCETVIEDLRAGRTPLDAKQIRHRASAVTLPAEGAPAVANPDPASGPTASSNDVAPTRRREAAAGGEAPAETGDM